jgi:hypothetical protein
VKCRLSNISRVTRAELCSTAGTRVGLQVTGKVLGAAASAIDVVDLTLTLLREDPNIDTAFKIVDQLIPQIEELER